MRADGETLRGSTKAVNAGTLAHVRSLANRRLPLVAEMGFLGLVIGAWELARMPLQGSMPLSLAHARDWLALEHALRIDAEAALIRFVHDAGLERLLHWSYYNFHLPVLFGFMALVRLLRPERYPFLRTAFVLSHVPALIVIGLYPLAPPRWVPGMPFAVAAPVDLNGAWHNATAAAASQHVGYPLFIAAATVWLVRSRLAWLAFLYPAAVLLIVVGTANHYLLDGIVGGLCIAFGFAAALLVNGRAETERSETPAQLGIALLAALGYALVVRAIDTASALSLPPQAVTGTDVVLVVGILAVVASWWLSRAEPRPAPRRGPQDARSRA